MIRNPTRAVRIGSVTIGAGHPIAVQSMTATQTQDIDATVAPGERPGTPPAPTSCGSPSTARPTPTPSPKSAARRRPIWSSICRRTTGWPSGSRRTSTRSATTPATSTTTSARSRGRRRCATWSTSPRQRLRDPRRRQLRQRRSGPASQIRPERLDLADARQRAGALPIARRARLHALLRVAEGLRSARR